MKKLAIALRTAWLSGRVQKFDLRDDDIELLLLQDYVKDTIHIYISKAELRLSWLSFTKGLYKHNRLSYPAPLPLDHI